jgi:hypothetical protein
MRKGGEDMASTSETREKPVIRQDSEGDLIKNVAGRGWSRPVKVH